MILTGPELQLERCRKRIVIEPFDSSLLEPNSYGFRLARHMICYEEAIVDARRPPNHRHMSIPDEGMVLRPGKFYLGSTIETMGSDHYAATLYARRSVSTLGIWIQFSAPLGHVGAVIPWTLEMRVTAPVIVYPNMQVGKIAFWLPQGNLLSYGGKYRGSRTTIPSRMGAETVGTEATA